MVPAWALSVLRLYSSSLGFRRKWPAAEHNDAQVNVPGSDKVAYRVVVCEWPHPLEREDKLLGAGNVARLERSVSHEPREIPLRAQGALPVVAIRDANLPGRLRAEPGHSCNEWLRERR